MSNRDESFSLKKRINELTIVSLISETGLFNSTSLV
jgi:hypothetical protein